MRLSLATLSHGHRSVMVLAGGLALAASALAATAVMARPEPSPVVFADPARIMAATLDLIERDRDRLFAELMQTRLELNAARAELAALRVPAPAESTAVPAAAPLQLAAIDPAAIGSRAPAPDAAKDMLKPVPPARAARDAYLCDVYRRTPVKRDSSGDFTWKDAAAAKRLNMDLCGYAIGGMNPDFREALYAFGQAADAKGLRWSMLSGFRDDYRQKIASGFKAHGGNSKHGGSRATRGYGDGQAIDIAAAPGTAIERVLALVDQVGRRFGLARPMPGADPAHVQAAGAWHAIAAALRLDRGGVREAAGDTPVKVAARAVKVRQVAHHVTHHRVKKSRLAHRRHSRRHRRV